MTLPRSCRPRKYRTKEQSSDCWPDRELLGLVTMVKDSKFKLGPLQVKAGNLEKNCSKFWRHSNPSTLFLSVYRGNLYSHKIRESTKMTPRIHD